jgi:hypothetical protein
MLMQYKVVKILDLLLLISRWGVLCIDVTYDVMYDVF